MMLECGFSVGFLHCIFVCVFGDVENCVGVDAGWHVVDVNFLRVLSCRHFDYCDAMFECRGSEDLRKPRLSDVVSQSRELGNSDAC